ncbi:MULTISPECIES: hypothetical protein [Saccharibacillus]|uniref:hypothetical protein n=1 Tax=Saccharibacillus TaxID=456492 RepID=UPI0012398E23|nr:hypothetical protein [Saccharibacillus sp. WB 17]MWJ31436.1 hypothetical protein [Saccharibacillus sp. WB 17]
MQRFFIMSCALLLILMSVNLFVPPGKALACSCSIPATADLATEKAAAVLTGTVIGIGKFKDGRNEAYDAVTLAVDESWKGVNEPEVVIYTSWSSCQFDFEKGKRYLLYPYEHDGRYEVANCGRSGEIDPQNPENPENARAAADLRQLGAGTQYEVPPEVLTKANEETGNNRGWVAALTGIVLFAAAFGVWQWRKRSSKARE